MNSYFGLFWVLIPAGLANMAPVFAQRLWPRWVAAIDGGRELRGTRIFGAHKTWRGLISGVFAGAFGGWFMHELSQTFVLVSRAAPETWVSAEVFGAWLGFWALAGDLVKSFFKRRTGLKPGQPWIPFDQVDWLLGALFGAALLTPVRWWFAGSVLFIGLVLHFIVKALGYFLRLSEHPI